MSNKKKKIIFEINLEKFFEEKDDISIKNY